ncbi:MAG TPA: dephospho-CoA kinase [Chloroflexia bacterium]|nr:dephospho-CoA kinase [Chloroflexia bacterium]
MPYHGKTLIGLTGNIACGKSTVLRQLRELGAYTIDADMLIHAILRKGEPAYWPVITEFGPSILDTEGEIDRRALGRIVFADPEKLRRLEEIEHPIVRRVIDQEIGDAQEPVVALDAIKLIESGWADKCDVVWVVTCPLDQQIERLMQTRGYSPEEAQMRIGSQSAQEEKVRRANVVIDNAGTLEELHRQVLEAWEAIGVRDQGSGVGAQVSEVRELGTAPEIQDAGVEVVDQ